MKRQKRVAAIHDFSGFGKCSLTVALPVISAAGIEVSAMPTAVLSTHTGGFSGFTYRDLTSDLKPFMNHWKSLDISFDCIYSGFLGSFEQLELIGEFVDLFKTKDNFFLADPVMGDNGKLYSVFTPEFVKGMAKLCTKADLIIPNITEATMMLGMSYHPGPYDKKYIEKILHDLSGLGPSRIVLTGVFFNDLELGAATYDKKTNNIQYIFSDRIEGYYHGTGDLFGSALTGALLNGFDLTDSTRIAIKLTTRSIRRTALAGTDPKYGVDFEECIPDYLKDLKLV